MKTPTDVIILGGGVIGCSLAYFLRKKGIAVTLLEQDEIGGQASGAAAGLLAPLGPLTGPGPFADLVLAGFRQFPALVAELEEATGLRLGYAASGALRVVRNPKRVAHLQKRLRNWQPLGLELHWLSGEEARQREPLLAPDVCAAVYAPEEAQISAPLLVQAFADAARRLGAVLLPRQSATGLITRSRHVVGVTTAHNETIVASHLIIASGVWAARCGAWLSVQLPITPLHGQLLALPQATPALRHILFGDAAYLLPRGDQLIVGATREDTGFTARVTPEGVAWLSASAARLVPSLADRPILSTWAGLRPRTPDARPILGPLPAWENVAIAAGHNSVGVLLSAITGASIAELLATGSSPEIIRSFAPVSVP